MNLWQNIKFTINLFYIFYIKKACNDPFLKFFVFRSEYYIDGAHIHFKRIKHGGKIIIECYSRKYPKLNNYMIDSFNTMNAVISITKVPIVLCNYCGRPLYVKNAISILNGKTNSGNPIYNSYCNNKEYFKFINKIKKGNKNHGKEK